MIKHWTSSSRVATVVILQLCPVANSDQRGRKGANVENSVFELLIAVNCILYIKAATDLRAVAVMQHETCICAHVRGNNIHSKQPQTINKLRTNQRFELVMLKLENFSYR